MFSDVRVVGSVAFEEAIRSGAPGIVEWRRTGGIKGEDVGLLQMPRGLKNHPTYAGYVATPDGRIFRKTKLCGGIAIRFAEVATREDRRGYLLVNLHHCGRVKTMPVAHFVCESFHGTRPAGYTVDHVNGMKADNRSENLECVPPGENMRRAGVTGLRVNGHGASRAVEVSIAGEMSGRIFPSVGLAAKAIGGSLHGIHHALKNGRTYTPRSTGITYCVKYVSPEKAHFFAGVFRNSVVDQQRAEAAIRAARAAGKL